MMEWTLPRDAFYAAVLSVQRATATRVIQPILANILLESDDGQHIRLTGTDMDFTIVTTMTGTVSQPGKTTLSAKKIAEILAKLPAGNDVTLTVSEGMAQIKSGASVFDLRTMPAEDFPVPTQLATDGSQGQAVTVQLAPLVQAIGQTAFAAANFETNNVLGGVFFKVSEGMLEMAATDGSRLARAIEASSVTQVAQETTAIIPVRVLMDVMKLLGGEMKDGSATTEEQVTIVLAEGQIAFHTQRYQMTSRLLEGQYPQYQQLIPAENKITIMAKRRQLIDSLERTAVMANERTHVVKMMFDKHSQELTLAANTPELGDSKDSLPVEFNGEEPLHIAFNYKFLLDALKVIPTDDIRMETNGALAPTLFRGKDKDNYLCLVMPVQVK